MNDAVTNGINLIQALNDAGLRICQCLQHKTDRFGVIRHGCYLCLLLAAGGGIADLTSVNANSLAKSLRDALFRV